MILLLANNDWSNVGYEFSRSLQSIGVDAKMYVWNLHAFNYYREGLLLQTRPELKQLVKDADIIQFMHSQYVKTGIDLRKKRCFVFHGGSRYRENSNVVNMIFNPYVEKTLIQTTNLMGLGAKNEVWMLPAVNTYKIKPEHNVLDKVSDKIVIGHFPGESIHKGTDRITKVVKELQNDSVLKDKFIFKVSREQVSWEDNINRISECDICISNLNNGVWGVTDLEAAALGCVVVTNFYELERYESEYGRCGLTVANNEEELFKSLKAIINISNNDYFLKLKELTRDWVEKFHSYEPIGRRLAEIYGIETT